MTKAPRLCSKGTIPTVSVGLFDTNSMLTMEFGKGDRRHIEFSRELREYHHPDAKGTMTQFSEDMKVLADYDVLFSEFNQFNGERSFVTFYNEVHGRHTLYISPDGTFEVVEGA